MKDKIGILNIERAINLLIMNIKTFVNKVYINNL